MKLLLIDMGNLDYFKEFSANCSKKIDTTIVTKYYEDNNGLNMKYFFYKYSQKMKPSKLRTIVRGIEYLIGYHRTYNLIKANKYDIVHIHWALVYPIDKHYFKKIKKTGVKLIYTAHDVIPHIQTKNGISNFKNLYSFPDTLIVHGKELFDEMKKYYPEYCCKTYIQYHGVYKLSDYDFKNHYDEINSKIIPFIKSNDSLIFGSIGQIFYNKGLDRVLKYWLENERNSKNFLIVMGRVREMYPDLEKLIFEIQNFNNVFLYLDRFSDEESELYHSISDIILIPYRHASMSGVLFSAAQHGKTVLATETGAISEYVKVSKDAFLVKNTDQDISKELKYISDKFTKEDLQNMGKSFSHDIYENFNWDKIINDLIKNVYEKKFLK